jgi:hypothetical protein
MRTISLAVSEKNYELFRQLAQTENRSIASLIRDAMADYILRSEREEGDPAVDLADATVRRVAAAAGPGRYKIIAEVSEID